MFPESSCKEREELANLDKEKNSHTIDHVKTIELSECIVIMQLRMSKINNDAVKR